jgi:hypothetical protein
MYSSITSVLSLSMGIWGGRQVTARSLIGTETGESNDHGVTAQLKWYCALVAPLSYHIILLVVVIGNTSSITPGRGPSGRHCDFKSKIVADAHP